VTPASRTSQAARPYQDDLSNDRVGPVRERRVYLLGRIRHITQLSLEASGTAVPERVP
jgi:hypothetical protein